MSRPEYGAFLAEDPERQYLYWEDLPFEFEKWLNKIKMAEHPCTGQPAICPAGEDPPKSSTVNPNFEGGSPVTGSRPGTDGRKDKPMILNAKAEFALYVFAIIALIVLALNKCGNPSVDEESLRLNTEAERVSITCGSVPLTIAFYNHNADLTGLLPIPETAYLWNESVTYRLIMEGNGGSCFYMKLDPYYIGDPSHRGSPALKSGTYNISMAMNGVGGIHTLSGSFRITNRVHFVDGRDLH